MAKTYFFYDLETSGLNPRDDRIMQFAGIRTDEDLKPIGEPYNILVELCDDTLPNPQALMVTGITPQQTREAGYSEADFARMFVEEVATPDTTIVGYNSVRFDDEFIRALLWRNFYDPYEWSYKDGRSRWDLLDVVRMTRALRPEGIEWPVVDGKPTNRLELIAAQNGLNHEKAHDALSDVEALIGVAQLIKKLQPDLYKYLYKLRDKAEVKKVVSPDSPVPFVYTSGRYDNAFEKTSVVVAVAEAEHGNAYVYDLRHDPRPWLDMNDSDLRRIVNTPYRERGDDYVALPVKKLQYNRCPAVAPLGVLEQAGGWERIGLDAAKVTENLGLLRSAGGWAERLQTVLGGKPDYPKSADAEGQLYDGFVDVRDKLRAETVRAATKPELKTLQPKFDDSRLAELFVRYKARNYPNTLAEDEHLAYETYKRERLARQSHGFATQLQQAASKTDLSDHQLYVLEELQLWYEAVMPAEE